MANMSMISAIQVQPEASTIIHAAPTHLGTQQLMNEQANKQNLGAIGTSTFENGVGVLHDDVTRDVGLEVHNPKKYDLSNYQDMPGSPKSYGGANQGYHVQQAINTGIAGGDIVTGAYQGDNQLIQRARDAYTLEAVAGSGAPWAWSGNYLAVAIGDWISIETAAEGSSTAGGSSSSTARYPGGQSFVQHRVGAPGKHVINVGSEIMAMDCQRDCIAILTKDQIRVWTDVDIHSRGASFEFDPVYFGHGDLPQPDMELLA